MSILSAWLWHTKRLQKASRWGIRETLVGDMPSQEPDLSAMKKSITVAHASNHRLLSFADLVPLSTR